MFTLVMRTCVSDAISNLSPLIQRQLTQWLDLISEMATQMRSGRNTPGNPLQQAAMLVIPILLFQRAKRNRHPIRRLRSYLAVSFRRGNKRR